MLRCRDCDGPWVPGKAVRFVFPDAGDADEEMIRERVQDGGEHLFVLHLPVPRAGSPVKVLAEAYYPDEMRESSWLVLDPRQRADWQDGRLIVISTIPVKGSHVVGGGLGSVNAFVGPLDEQVIVEIRRNNRSARLELKRQSTASARKQELEDHQRQEEDRLIEESGFPDFFVERSLDSRRHVLRNAFVPQYTGGGR